MKIIDKMSIRKTKLKTFKGVLKAKLKAFINVKQNVTFLSEKLTKSNMTIHNVFMFFKFLLKHRRPPLLYP